MDNKNHTNIIQFPNTKNENFELQRKKINIAVNTIDALMHVPNWDNAFIDDEVLQVLSEFGETLKFHPNTAARLISVLASQNLKQRLEEDFV